MKKGINENEDKEEEDDDDDDDDDDEDEDDYEYYGNDDQEEIDTTDPSSYKEMNRLYFIYSILEARVID